MYEDKKQFINLYSETYRRLAEHTTGLTNSIFAGIQIQPVTVTKINHLKKYSGNKIKSFESEVE